MFNLSFTGGLYKVFIKITWLNKLTVQKYRIKLVSWENSCVEKYSIELYKGRILEYSLRLSLLPQNRLDPIFLRAIWMPKDYLALFPVAIINKILVFMLLFTILWHFNVMIYINVFRYQPACKIFWNKLYVVF